MNALNSPFNNIIYPFGFKWSVDFDIVCIGGTSIISSDITNGSGVYDYQWQSSADGINGWADITTNGNMATYTTVGAVAGTTYYRVLLVDLSNGCGDPISNVPEPLLTVEVITTAPPIQTFGLSAITFTVGC